MSEKFQNKYRIESTRLQNWNYGWNTSYFITINTKYNKLYFGKIVNKKMILSDIGNLAEKYWYEISNHFNFVKLNVFIVMPNHIHGIITINKSRKMNVETRHCLVSTNDKINIGHNRCRNLGKNNISSIVGSYKSIVCRMAHKINPKFEWQSRFDDRIIWDSIALKNYQQYIRNNPQNRGKQ